MTTFSNTPSGRLIWYGTDATSEKFDELLASIERIDQIDVLLSVDDFDARRRILSCGGARVDLTYEHAWGIKMEGMDEASDALVRRWSGEAEKILQ